MALMLDDGESGENVEEKSLPESCGILKSPSDHHYAMELLVVLRLLVWPPNQEYSLSGVG